MRRFAFHEVVRFSSADPDFAEINGLEGYVSGLGDADDEEIAVHFYAIERTWIVPASSCISLGHIDEAVHAHVEWASRRVAEENGNALEAPPSWRKHLAGHTVLFQSIGESGAQVYRIGDVLFLKSEPIDALAELPGEIERLRWLGDTGIPCPEVVDTTTYADRHWLLMSALPGRDLAQSPDIGPIAACEIVAQALKTLHDLDPATCPFDHNVEHRIAEARARLDGGIFNGDDPAGGLAAYAMLFSTRPAHEDFVVTHGDACMPNFLARDGQLTGLIDCGRLGVADRYQDLALAARSIGRNYGRAYLPAFFSAYGVDQPDEQKLAWYALLDEFF